MSNLDLKDSNAKIGHFPHKITIEDMTRMKSRISKLKSEFDWKWWAIGVMLSITVIMDLIHYYGISIPFFFWLGFTLSKLR